MKKFGILIITGLIISLIAVGAVSAGVIFEIGTLTGLPPVGMANWTAWIDEPKNYLPAGMPNEILTEDNTNSATYGVDGGYVLDVTTPIWLLQVENFDVANEQPGDTVKMIFGGLGSTPQLWDYSFDWTNAESVTLHGAAPLRTNSEFCPAITNTTSVDNTQTVNFTAEPSRTYYVYKSTQPSGADNIFSGGRYHYLKTVITNGSGFGTFTDNEPLDVWYTVIPVDEATGNLGGCHSEEAASTAVHMGELAATLSSTMRAVNIAWNTYSEAGIVGFNVYRALSEGGIQERLNGEIIQAACPGVIGGEYQYVDSRITPGFTYFYWVEAVGVGEKIGPESVRVPFLFYLPFILMN